MAHRLLWDNDHELTIILVVLYGQKFMLYYDGLSIQRLFCDCCLNGGHGYGFASSVGHPWLESIGLLVYDGMCTYSRCRCCITGPS
jgi:hypothetical protein